MNVWQQAEYFTYIMSANPCNYAERYFHAYFKNEETEMWKLGYVLNLVMSSPNDFAAEYLA